MVNMGRQVRDNGKVRKTMKLVTKLGLAAAGFAALIGLAKASVPADIVVIPGSFDVTPKGCTGACTITATATWQNVGDQAGTFTPSFVIDGMSLDASPSPVTLDAGQSGTFTVSATVSATGSPHSVCPYPNP